MLGKLVAVRIEDVGTSLQVTGLVAQAKNRKAAWTFKVTKGTAAGIPAKVVELEEDRENAKKA